MEFERAINYYELDGMNVVHHSNYIRYMEEARVYWLERIGLPYQKIEEDGIMIPVLEVHYKYKYPAKFGDVIIVNKENKKILGEGTTSHCFTNDNMKPVYLKKANKEFYEIFEKMLDKK